MIRLSSLNKYYNKNKSNQIHVIDNVNLRLPDTGFVTILGASGSGKTTLLNVIGGLDKATGTIEYDHAKFNKYSPNKLDAYRRENFGYIFQNYNLLLDETVYNNLRIALQALDFTDKEEVNKRINFSLKAVGLYHYRKKLANALSGGQMQRVSIARALVKNSKVIIADEPTGNLDSKNSIEIMNILKELSKQALIILVTHDKKLADLFSDEVIEIQDGKIIQIREGNKNTTYEASNDNNVYLQDMNLTSNDDNNLSYKFYTNNDTENKLDITLVEHNGTIYIKSNRRLRLVEDSPINLIDDHYKEEVVKTDYDFDTSWYKDSKKNSKSKSFFDTFKTAFKAFKHVKVRTVFFYVAMAFIGLIVGILNISLSSYSTIDSTTICNDDNLYKLVYDEDKYSGDVIQTAYENNIIDKIYSTYDSEDYKLTTGFSSYSTDTVDFSCRLLSSELIESYKLLKGEASTNRNEIVLGKKLAEYIIEEADANVTFDSLIGQVLNQGSGGYLWEDVVYLKQKDTAVTWYTFDNYSYLPNDVTIVGISSKDTYACYSKMGYDIDNLITVSQDDDYNFMSYQTSYGYYPYEKNTYKIVAGVDLDPSSTNTCLISIDADGVAGIDDFINSYMGTSITIYDEDNNSKEFTIIGAYSYIDGSKSTCKYIINDIDCLESNKNGYNYIYAKDDYSYNIIEGRDIINDDEVLVSTYNPLNVGDTVNDLTIVGRYVLTSSENLTNYHPDYALLANLKTAKKNSSFNYYNACFTVFDYDDAKAYFEACGFEMGNYYNLTYKENLQDNKTSKTILFIVIFVLVAVSLIYIYFSLRSRMLSDIYTIGVYRALGFSKGKITLKYAFETLFITLFTTLLGYILTSVVYTYFNKKVADLGGELNNIAAYPFTYIIGALIVILSVFIGIVPIFFLLRKTPSEIINKYDI